MSKLSLWNNEEEVEVFNDVSDIKYINDDLSFISEGMDVSFKALRPNVIVCEYPDDVTLDCVNHKEYQIHSGLSHQEQLEQQIADLTDVVEMLKTQIENLSTQENNN